MLSLALLTIPGLALYSRMKPRFSLPELFAAAIALSFAILPFASLLSRPLGLPAAAAAALFTAALLFSHGGRAIIERADWKPLVSAAFFGLLVFAVLSQYLVAGAVHPTQAGDTVWHLSNAARYELSPLFPPEDAYSPGYSLIANGAFTILLAEADVHVAMALAAAGLFLGVYVLGQRLHKGGLAAAWLYSSFAGLSWLALGSDLFRSLVFSPGFKFDPTLLFFFLPQPQAIGLLLFAFVLFTAATKDSRSCGLALAALFGYHLQTACVVLIALLAWHAIKREKPAFLVWAAPAIVFLLPLVGASAGDQLGFGFFAAALPTIALTVLPLASLAWFGKCDSLLSLVAGICVALALFVAVPATDNGYRFLVYAILPLAVMAGPALKRWPAVLLAVALCISSLLLVAVYASPAYHQAAPSELAALEWVRQNTPKGAVFLEAYSFFPRVPLMAGRRILYGGMYGPQYHDYDGSVLVERITGETSPLALRALLVDNGVDYVFLGEREASLPFAPALTALEQPFPGVFKV